MSGLQSLNPTLWKLLQNAQDNVEFIKSIESVLLHKVTVKQTERVANQIKSRAMQEKTFTLIEEQMKTGTVHRNTERHLYYTATVETNVSQRRL